MTTPDLSLPSAGEKRSILDKILASPTFRAKDTVSEVLKYLVEQEIGGAPDQAFNERAILFDCNPDEYKRTEKPGQKKSSWVRVTVLNVRQALDDYYRREGSADPIWIHLSKNSPKAAYRPLFGPPNVVHQSYRAWGRMHSNQWDGLVRYRDGLYEFSCGQGTGPKVALTWHLAASLLDAQEQADALVLRTTPPEQREFDRYAAKLGKGRRPVRGLKHVARAIATLLRSHEPSYPFVSPDRTHLCNSECGDWYEVTVATLLEQVGSVFDEMPEGGMADYRTLMEVLNKEAEQPGSERVRDMVNTVEAAVFVAMVGKVITELKKLDDFDRAYAEFQQLNLYKKDVKPAVTKEDKMFSMAIGISMVMLSEKSAESTTAAEPAKE